MGVTMSGRQLAYAALWANGAPVKLCTEIMSVSTHTVRDARQRLQAKYAAEGITIRNGADMAHALAVAFPMIYPPQPATATNPDPGRRGGRLSTITPEQLAEIRRLRAEGLSFTRIAEQLGVNRNPVVRAFRLAEQQA